MYFPTREGAAYSTYPRFYYNHPYSASEQAPDFSAPCYYGMRSSPMPMMPSGTARGTWQTRHERLATKYRNRSELSLDKRTITRVSVSISFFGNYHETREKTYRDLDFTQVKCYCLRVMFFNSTTCVVFW